VTSPARIGAWCSTGSVHVAELLDAAGFDYVCVDCQHGLSGGGADALPALLGVRRSVPVVRVPSNDGGWIGRALDTGAHAVIVPMVASADDARRAARACRYAPDGVRSWGTNRSSLSGTPAEVNAAVACYVMVETREAVDCADAIAATAGVDGIYLGPADLAVSMGSAPGGGDDDVEKAIERVRVACADAGIVAGIQANGGEDARRRVDQGFDMVTVATDVALLRAALADALRTARNPRG
jgi:4-hydroxy-2-oxoheptanedioate aldolase